MTTVIPDSRSEKITLAELLQLARGDLVEIRRPGGPLVATLQLEESDAKFDYSPYLEAAQTEVESYLRRGGDQRPGVTTAELFDTLNTLEESR